IVPELGDGLERGEHGSTFAGAALAASAALAAIDVIDDPQLLRGVRETGARFAAGLERMDAIVDVRARGLMGGVTPAHGVDPPAVAARALEAGLVLNVPGEGMLRFLPPLIIGDAEVDEP